MLKNQPESRYQGVRQFDDPAHSFRDLDAEGAAAIITAAADIALIIDADGIIRDLSVNDNDMPHDEYVGWLNRPWIDTVTLESRSKVITLLKESAIGIATRWRQVNHYTARGIDLPVKYATVPIGTDGCVVAIGRSAAAIAELQQRLLQAQQSMERNYRQIRNLETRYRLLFQLSSEAVFIADARNKKIHDSNPAAERMLGQDKTRIAGRKLNEIFDQNGSAIVDELLDVVLATGQGKPVTVTLAKDSLECLVSVTVFRQDGDLLYLMRVNQSRADSHQAAGIDIRNKLLNLVEAAPDGFVVTASDGRIVAANRAFVELTQTASEDRVRGESLDRWLGRPGVDLTVLKTHLREHGYVRLFATRLRGEAGSVADVEISATTVMNGTEPSFGFMIRDIGLRLDDGSRSLRRLSRPVEQLTELVGRLPLKDLVKESTDMLEKYCIEAALEISGKNRTSAAEILGLSRQSLYVKLRRHGIGDDGAEQLP